MLSAVEPDKFNVVLNPSQPAYGSIVHLVVRDPFAFDLRTLIEDEAGNAVEKLHGL